MFTKKYVGPVDCASCEKGIVNLCGMRADNVNWNRLPFREPTERIARVSLNRIIFILQYGQGFSKFLAATGVVVQDASNTNMRQSSGSRGHGHPQNQGHNQSQTHYGDQTSTDFTSPMKQARSHMRAHEPRTEIKPKKQMMATTLQANAQHKPMHLDTHLPNVRNIHGQSNHEI